MQRSDFTNLQCPVAHSLERAGEWWSILIMRDAFYGRTWFDEFQKSPSIAPGRPMSDPVFRPAAGEVVVQRMAKAAAPQTANTP